MIAFVRVDRDFADGKQVDDIMKRQFPPHEYMPLRQLLQFQDLGLVEVWALYADGELIGSASLLVAEDVAYLFYFALDDAYQGKGYGSAVLGMLRERYAGRAIWVDFELVDKTAENYAQRVRRRKFYLRNGFAETGWGTAYLGMQLEVFCMNGSFSIDRFREILERLPIENLAPQYFRV